MNSPKGILMKATKQHFPTVLFILLRKVIVTSMMMMMMMIIILIIIIIMIMETLFVFLNEQISLRIGNLQLAA